MRADRAYIAGLGTTGVLLASAILLLAVVSTLVAFRGWPGADLGEDIDNLVVQQRERSLPVEGPLRAALESAPGAGAVAGTPAPGTAAAAPPATGASPAASPSVSGLTRPGRGGVILRRGVSVPPGDATPRDVLQEPNRSTLGLLPETPVADQVSTITGGLATTTEGLTDGLGQTVGELNPGLGETLTDTGQFLAELIRALTQQPRR